MLNNKIFVVLFFLFFILIVKTEAYRIPRPESFKLPWTEDSMKKHNDAHEDLWNLQQGEFNFDIVTTQKTKATNGDLWLLQTGNTVRIQFRANNRNYIITPDGY